MKLQDKIKELGQKYNIRTIFKPFQFGQAQVGSEISTTGIPGIFRGLKFSTNTEIDLTDLFDDIKEAMHAPEIDRSGSSG